MKKIIITGATSMIGTALINAALQDQDIQKIYAVVRPHTENVLRIPSDPRIEIIPCDVDNYDELPDLIATSCDVFYHLAWPRTATYEEGYEDILLKCKNMQTIMKAVNAASVMECSKFVGAGSQSEYGLNDAAKLSPKTFCSPVRADGIIHLAAGQLAQILSSKLGMSCIWMRIFSIYGKYDRKNSLISSTITKLLNGEHCSFTPAWQLWDFLEARDAARAFYMAGEKVSGNHIYCLGSGTARPLREYIEIIRDIVAPGMELGFGEIPYPPEPVMNLCADITNLQQDAGWFPTITFEQGIDALVEDFHG
ncbi:MAG: NAD(P)-dependent oxidoreductase [Lachnospiraceae bacterium]|nr:NAD(P)-dependent oxidoreductase [Lachnospiraceae bacterium]